MSMRFVIAALALTLAVTAGCDKTATPAVDAPMVDAPMADALPPPLAPPAAMNPADLKDMTSSYACDGGSRVDIVRDVVARVALNNGQVVKLEVIERSTPPTFMDNGLTLELLPNGKAELSDANSGTLACNRVVGGSSPHRKE